MGELWMLNLADAMPTLAVLSGMRAILKARARARSDDGAPGEETFRLLERAIDNSQVGVTIADPFGVILYTNQAEARMHGYAVSELVGRSVRMLAPARVPEPGDPLVWMSARPRWKRESQNLHRDGRVFAVEIVSDVVHDDGGRVVGVVSCAQDISERKHAEAQRHLIETARLKSEFVANVSHELRTPLNAVIGFTALFLDTDLTPEQRGHAASVKQAAEALLALINDVLDFSKLEGGRMELELVDFDVGQLTRESLDEFGAAARARRIDLKLDVAANVPLRLRGDPGRLRQVLANLVGNAVKFTSRGGVVLRVVREGGIGRETTLRFEVADTGPGIAEESLRQLFEAFAPINGSSTREHGGTGLGLGISRKLVELMRGRIQVRSVEGEGSTFWFTVPLTVAPAAPAPKLAPASVDARSRSAVGALRARRVLVVDDNSMNLTVAVKTLERMGYLVGSAADGQEALDALRRVPYDLVLLDCQMPVMDGYRAAAEIRATKDRPELARIPIVAMTAHVLQGDRERCAAAGMNDYLSKPIDRAQLQLALDRWIGREVLDPAALARLRELDDPGDDDLVSVLVGQFAEQAPLKIARLREAAAAGALAEVAREAHALKSTSATLGAMELSRVCRELELAAAGEDAQAVAALLDGLDLEYRSASAALAAEIAPPERRSRAAGGAR